MTEQRLEGHDVLACFQLVSGIGVAKCMYTDLFIDLGLLYCCLKFPADKRSY